MGFCAAQVLLTEDDFSDPIRHANLRHTLDTLLELGAIPVLETAANAAPDNQQFHDLLQAVKRTGGRN